MKNKRVRKKSSGAARLIYLPLLPLTFCLLLFTSCSTKPTDLRALVPSDTLIYLETPDLGKMLESLTTNRTFRENAMTAKDLSALKAVQAAIAVTGFETSEKQVTDENAILNFKPRFVAVADTHLWSWQTSRFAEGTLGNFVNEIYGGEVELVVTAKDGGGWYEWTAQDDRRVFAFVEGSQIFFSNDETAIQKCLAVRRGASESLLKSGNFRRSAEPGGVNNLAFGFVSAEGVAQMANLAGVSAAVSATEEEDGRNLIARILPQVLRNTVTQIAWTARAAEDGIEDNYSISLKPETASVFTETLAASSENPAKLYEFIPADLNSATRYAVRDPWIGWQSLILKVKDNTDQLSGQIVGRASGSLLEPYGITDAEGFFKAVDPAIVTVQFDSDGDKAIVAATVKDLEEVKQSIAPVIDFKAPAEKGKDAEVWFSKDRQFSAALAGDVLILGTTESVAKCLEAKLSGVNITKLGAFSKFAETRSSAVTFGQDSETAEKVIGILGVPKEGNKPSTGYLTQTSFSTNGIDRKIVSDFGLIGSILQQIDQE